MKPVPVGLPLTLLAVLAGCAAQPLTDRNSLPKPSTIVIVHGAWGGGWAFREVEDLLNARGYRVYRPTLTGQGERVHLADTDVGLDTHITDVVNTVLFEELDNIALIGHSYGGMVVTGVADRLPGRIAHLIYIDAFVPCDGESVLTIHKSHGREPGWLTNAQNGFVVPGWIKPDKAPPKDVPHPLKTFTDPIVLKNPRRFNIPTNYILTVEAGKIPQNDSFFPHYQRAKDYGWPVTIFAADHNPQWSKPQEEADLFIKLIENRE